MYWAHVSDKLMYGAYMSGQYMYGDHVSGQYRLSGAGSPRVTQHAEMVALHNTQRRGRPAS